MAQAITANEIIDNFKKIVTTQYICFEGRMSLREYWLYFLPVFILSLIPFVGWVLSVALLLPTIGATTRRLHDVDKTGWLQICVLICGIGYLVPLFFCIQAGTAGDNKYGPAPAGTSSPAE